VTGLNFKLLWQLNFGPLWQRGLPEWKVWSAADTALSSILPYHLSPRRA